MLILYDKGLPDEYLKGLKEKLPSEEFFAFSGTGEVYNSILNHPDIYLFQLDEKRVIYSPDTSGEIISALKARGVELIKGEKAPRGEYPSTVPFNAVRAGGKLFHNLDHTDLVILQEAQERGLKQVNTSQGYTKCSTIVISDEAIITSDRNIEKKAIEEGLDVLYVSSHDIILPGEKHGFIGGSSGKLTDGRIIFLGDITSHEDFEKISSLLAKHNVEYIYLKGLPLYDAGSLMAFS